MENIIEKYKCKILELDKVNKGFLDCKQAEPYYLEILSFIKEHPERHDFFVRDFINRLKKGIQPWEVIQFCMRELQWIEIRDAAIKEKSETDDWRVICIMNDILAVYEEEWEDSDLYPYYSDNKK